MQKRVSTQKIIKEYMSSPDITMNEVAKRFGVSRQYVFSVLSKNGIPTHDSHRKKNVKRDEALEMAVVNAIKEGKKYLREIAKDFNISVYRAEDIARRHGVKTPHYIDVIKARANARYKEIVDTLKNNPDMKYEDVAEMFGVSVSTVYLARVKCGLHGKRGSGG